MNPYILLLITLLGAVLALWMMWPWYGLMIWLGLIMPHRTDEQLKQMVVTHKRGIARPMILTELHRRNIDIAFAIPLLARIMLSRSFMQRAMGSRCMHRFAPHVLAGIDYVAWRISPAARTHLQSLIEEGERHTSLKDHGAA